MHILFINPTFFNSNTDERAGVDIHWGLSSMSAMLRQNGHKTSAAHFDWFPNDQELIDAVRQKIDTVDILAIGFTFHQEAILKSWVKTLGDEFDLPIVVGGLYPSVHPDEVISWENVDYLCRGEGERPLLELLDVLETGSARTDLKSIWFKRNGQVIENPIRPVEGTLDDLPSYDYSLFDLTETNICRKRLKPVLYLASRGCPYSCSYCATQSIRALYPNPSKWVRFQSVDRALNELERLLSLTPGASTVTFADISFNLSKKWILEFCSKYPKRIGLPFRCTVRIDAMSREIAQAMAGAGCYRVSFGIESGSEWLRRKILNRPWSNEQILEQALNIHNAGLQITASNMVGLPHETLKMSLDTMKFNAQCKVDTSIVSIFHPHPNTPLKDYCKKHGMIKGKALEDVMTDTVLRQDCITAAEVRFAHRTFRSMVAIYRWIDRLSPATQKMLTGWIEKLYLNAAVPRNAIVATHDRYFTEWLLGRQYKRLEAKLQQNLQTLRDVRPAWSEHCDQSRGDQIMEPAGLFATPQP